MVVFDFGVVIAQHGTGAPTTLPGWVAIGGYVGAGILVALGLSLVWRRKTGVGQAEHARRTFRDRMSKPTRMACGLSAIVLGYHLGAYVSPDHWFGLKVPLERWWMVVGWAVLMVGGSLLVDRLAERGQKGSAGARGSDNLS